MARESVYMNQTQQWHTALARQTHYIRRYMTGERNNQEEPHEVILESVNKHNSQRKKQKLAKGLK